MRVWESSVDWSEVVLSLNRHVDLVEVTLLEA